MAADQQHRPPDPGGCPLPRGKPPAEAGGGGVLSGPAGDGGVLPDLWRVAAAAAAVPP